MKSRLNNLLQYISKYIIFFSIALSISLGQSKNSQKKEVYGIVFLETMFSDVALNDASAAIKVYLNELQRKFDLGFELKPIMFKNNEDLLKSLSKENLAIINFSAVDYLHNKSRLPVSPMLVSAFKDSPYEEYLLLVRSDNKINSIALFSNQKIGIASKENNPLTYMWLKVLLSKNKVINKEKILNNITEGKGDSQNIMSVFFGQLDACIVSKKAFELMSELNPQIGKQLKILASSPGYVISVSCYSTKFMQSQYRNNLYDASLKVGAYPAGKQLFALMKTEKVLPFKEEYLDGVKKLLSEYYSLGNK